MPKCGQIRPLNMLRYMGNIVLKLLPKKCLLRSQQFPNYKREIWSRVSTRRRKSLTNGDNMKKIMSLSSLFAILLTLVVSATALSADFPDMPNPTKTPGALCTNSPIRRYPEGIVYCNRDVDSRTKREIIKEYDQEFGYRIEQMNRQDFKIDHFIPLSIGGGNSKDNLWPQHKSVYTITDPLEQALFDKISQGRIKQVEAIRVMKEGKLNLGRVPELIDYVNSL